jgi:hypothetical protein
MDHGLLELEMIEPPPRRFAPPLLARRGDRSRILRRLSLLITALLIAVPCALAEDLPRTISDTEFWRMVTDFSESGGAFPQQYMSNEDSAQFVIPALKQTARLGGVYIGVGLEQNFTYIAALQPKIAFVIDIRRDNLIEHLVYKALFELSTDRADFISRLFSRKRPPGLNANSSIKAIFDAYQSVEADPVLYDADQRSVINQLINEHRFPLNDADKAAVSRILNAFRVSSPATLRGQGDNTNPTYAQLMTATDLTGRNQSYLGTEEVFKSLQDFERQNRLIPLVGDFAGDKAIVSVGRYLKERSAVADVFYLSNVERYLFDQGDNAKRFYTNVAALPLGPASIFIRSVTSDISVRLGIPIPEGTTKWRSFLSPISENLKAFEGGNMKSYTDIFKFDR